MRIPKVLVFDLEGMMVTSISTLSFFLASHAMAWKTIDKVEAAGPSEGGGVGARSIGCETIYRQSCMIGNLVLQTELWKNSFVFNRHSVRNFYFDGT